ncbi:hypothetical protein [Kribbella koreensis]
MRIQVVRHPPLGIASDETCGTPLSLRRRSPADLMVVPVGSAYLGEPTSG